MKNTIVLGKSGRENITIDLDVLIRTRLLLQANSGGGKSWAMRRIIEQCFGKVPIWIYDPEGEFPSLRQKFGFVLVGRGGETPTDLRSAELVVHKLLQLGASVVFDLYDLKPATRHQYMKLSLTALMNAPKSMWGPRMIFVDEAHKFCPESKAGRSEASEAMVDLATAGRKRGFCAVWATQRLAKLNKDASAELSNRLVGPTFEDLDLERAADLLSVTRSDRRKFFEDMKMLEPGNFWGFGRAIAKKRTLIRVGAVKTAHPQVAGGKFTVESPPAPNKIKKLLPKLADLPKEAEEKARTSAEFQKEIRSLKAQLRVIPAAAKAVIKTKTVEVSVVKPRDLRNFESAVKTLHTAGKRAQDVAAILELALQKAGRRPVAPPPAPRPTPRPPLRVPAPEVTHVPCSKDDGDLGKMERAVLGVLAQYPDGCAIGKLALLAGYRVSGGFRNSLSTLRSCGYINGPNTGTMTILSAGEAAIAGRFEPLPAGRDLVDYWLNHRSLGKNERAVLETLLLNPDGFEIEELASRAGYAVSGGFRNSLSTLRTAGLLVGKNTETMRACEELLEAGS